MKKGLPTPTQSWQSNVQLPLPWQSSVYLPLPIHPVVSIYPHLVVYLPPPAPIWQSSV